MPEDLLMTWSCLPEGSSFTVEFPEASQQNGRYLTGVWEFTKLPEFHFLVKFDKELQALVIPDPREATVRAIARSATSPYSYYLTSGDVIEILKWVEAKGLPLVTKDP